MRTDFNSASSPGPLLLILYSFFLLGFLGRPAAERYDDPASTVILISVDGFRWDYLDLYEAPALDSLARGGVRAERLIPVFPSKTFPNHYSMVTGLYPENHGIISNTMYDPEMKARFRMSDPSAVTDARWWGGEPVWVTAEAQGQIAATYFWPGSEADIRNVRPSYWLPYDGKVPGNDRVDQVLAWLDLPAEERPRLITLYFSDTDDAGHRHGPESEEVREAVVRVDGYLRRLVRGLNDRGILGNVHLIVTSDHGMAETSPERIIIIDDYFDPRDAHIIEYGPVLMAELPAHERDSAHRLLDDHRYVEAYWKEDLPERFHLDHTRTPSFVAVAAEGWDFSTRDRFERDPERYRGGAHGYDNLSPSMGGLFIGFGERFGRGQVVPAMDVVDVYNVICAILGLEPAPNDGDPAVAKHLVRSAEPVLE